MIRILETEMLMKTCELRKRRRKLENNDRQGDKGLLHGADFIRLLKSLRPRWYGHVEIMQNQRMSKQTATLQRKEQ